MMCLNGRGLTDLPIITGLSDEIHLLWQTQVLLSVLLQGCGQNVVACVTSKQPYQYCSAWVQLSVSTFQLDHYMDHPILAHIYIVLVVFYHVTCT
jgi:hypothetical protein